MNKWVIARKTLKIADAIIQKLPLLIGELERERHRHEIGTLSRAGKSKNLFGKSGR